MTIAYWMLIAAVMMPYLTIALAKSAGGVDNRAPRPSLESLSGWRQRADWAHRNHFEAFPAFAAAVFVAELTHAPQSRIDQLAVIFVALRVIYTALYVADQATLRSAVWSLGLIAVLWPFVFPSPPLSELRALTSTPTGLSPAEHASLTWTHLQTRN